MDDVWINKKDRLPTAEDADPQGCVLVWHTFNGLMVTGWFQVERGVFLNYWQPAIPGPKEETA